MGLNPVKRREMRNSDKFKNVFNFEWADKDDTMQLASSIHMNKLEPKLLFGKGVRAGIDLAQQKASETNGVYKSKYDKIMEGWQTKKYEEMTERDWRIFR
jgi:ATP-dependent RNA helicase DDX23/PRP28